MNCSSPVEQKPSRLPMTRSSSVLPLRAAPAMNKTRIGRLRRGEGPSRLSLESHRGVHAELVPCNAHGDSRMPPGFVNKRLSTCAIGLAPVRLVPVAGVRDDNLQGVGNTCGLELGLRASDQ